MMKNAGTTKQSPPISPPHQPPREGSVLVVEEERGVQVGLDLRPFGNYADLVPLAQLGLGNSCRRDRTSLAVHYHVEPKVVLEGIGPDQQVVSSILCPEDDASARVLLAGDRPEADGDIDVAEFLILEDRDCPGLGLS